MSLSSAGARFILRIGRRLRSELGSMRARVDPRVVSIVSRSPLLCSLYYTFWASAFRREQQAVLQGRRRYELEQAIPEETSSFLRRNVHGIEKGLLMRPRRSHFATGYIGATVTCYEQMLHAAQTRPAPMDELEWAHDVLREFFDVVGDHPEIQRSRARFGRLPKPSIGNGSGHDDGASGRRVPYHRQGAGTPVEPGALLELARRRRSVRWFLQRPVPRELLDRAMDVARLSPSACNRQPFVFRFLDDPDLVRRVAAISIGTGGYDHNIPVLGVVTGKLRHYPMERDRHLIYVDGSLAAMAFVLALETLELSSCCINWPDIESNEREIADVLELDPDERVIMLIAVGFPDPAGMVAYSQKKPLSQIRRFNLHDH